MASHPLAQAGRRRQTTAAGKGRTQNAWSGDRDTLNCEWPMHFQEYEIERLAVIAGAAGIRRSNQRRNHPWDH